MNLYNESTILRKQLRSVDVRFICKDNLYCEILYVTKRDSPEPVAAVCYVWMRNGFHASIHCSTPWTDRWWHWLWFVLKEITLISAALSPNGQCRCVRVHVPVHVYLHMCVHRQVHEKGLQICRQMSQKIEKLSLMLHRIILFTRGNHSNWKSKNWGLQRI